MQVVGITGGIGSGKSTVCQVFQTLGIATYIADEAARELINHDPEVKASIAAAFGEQLYVDGYLNRPAMAEIVFNNAEKLKELNGIVHPAVGRDFERWLKQQTGPYVLKESAVLIENKLYESLAAVILVVAPEALRLQRAVQRDQSSEAAIKARMSKQLSDAEKRPFAQHIITNDEQELLLPQVLKIHQQLSTTL